LRIQGYWTRPGARVFSKGLYGAGVLSEEGWKRVERANSPKELKALISNNSR